LIKINSNQIFTTSGSQNKRNNGGGKSISIKMHKIPSLADISFADKLSKAQLDLLLIFPPPALAKHLFLPISELGPTLADNFAHCTTLPYFKVRVIFIMLL
jgi:hypothetical protein